MNRAVVIVGLILLATGGLIAGGIIPLNVTTSLSTQCINSVVGMVPGAVICPVPASNIQGIALANVWLIGSDTNYVVHSTSVAFAQGPLMVSYQLGQGLALSSYSLGYCTHPSTNTYGDYCPSLTSIPVSAGALYGGLPTFIGSSPVISLNSLVLFQAKITDSSGASYVYTTEAIYIASSYPVTFKVLSSAGGGISGATIRLTGVGGLTYASTLTTDASGVVTINLPYGEYTAIASAPNFATGTSQSFDAWDSPTLIFTLQSEAVSSISVLVKGFPANAVEVLAPGALVSLYNSSGLQVGATLTTNSSGLATFTGTFFTSQSYFIEASWTISSGSSVGTPGTYKGQSVPFYPSKGAVELVIVSVGEISIGVGSAVGITTVPPEGVYHPAASVSSFTISETTASGVTFLGWNVNGTVVSQASTLALTIRGSTTIIPTSSGGSVVCTGSSCGGGGGGGSNGNVSGLVGGLVMATGFFIMAWGLTMREGVKGFTRALTGSRRKR